MKREYRANPEIELRQEPGQPVKIRGYAAVFNQLSEEIMFFRERVLPGAFSKSIKNDVRALSGHDSRQVLGRTTNKTLTLEEDDHGLRVEIIPPNTTAGHDVVESIKRGDIDQMSFGFQVVSDRWDKENGLDIRELLEVNLFEVSIVAFPAYKQTSVSVRSLWPDGMPEQIEKLGLSITTAPVPPIPPTKPSAARQLVDQLDQKYGIKKQS